MRAGCGCPVEDGIVRHDSDGPCLDNPGLVPTPADLCRADDHPYFGRDELGGRCYCGARSYPPRHRNDDKGA